MPKQVTAEPVTIIVVVATFLLAGLVKGVVGLGLPTVALALLTATLGLQTALALLLLPSVLTNVWQAWAGPALGMILRRMWTFLAAVFAGAWVGTAILAGWDTALLTALLGVLLVGYALASLMRLTLPPPGRAERWLSPVLGLVNGILTGMTGTFVLPGMMYLQAIGLTRHELVQALGVLFLTCTVALAIGMGARDLLSVDLATGSALGVPPALAGMWLGARLRRRLSEVLFRRLMFIALLVLGAHIAVQALI